jgi:hypothetical protein
VVFGWYIGKGKGYEVGYAVVGMGKGYEASIPTPCLGFVWNGFSFI